MDSSFIAEEMGLYQEIRTTLNHDELLIIMSSLQEHFLEGLAAQKAAVLTRSPPKFLFDDIPEEANEDFSLASESDYDMMIDMSNNHSNTSNMSNNSNTSNNSKKKKRKIHVSIDHPNSNHKIVIHNASISETMQTSPTINNTQKRNTMSTLNSSFNHSSSSYLPVINTSSKSVSSSPIIISSSNSELSEFHPPPSLTMANLHKFNDNNSKSRRATYNNLASGHGESFASLAAAVSAANNKNYTMRDITSARSLPPMTPRSTTGHYRMELFCDIKFVKKIFVRWISCRDTVLCHVASKTLAVLFGHAFLTPDQFLDLAELLLGVHEDSIFGDVQIEHRSTGVFFDTIDDISTSSSTYSESYEDIPTSEDDYEKKTIKKRRKKKCFSHSGSSADDEHEDENSNENDSSRSTRSASSTSNCSSNASSTFDPIDDIPYNIHWDQRLYCAMRILTVIVQNESVDEACVVALDEWFSQIVMDLFVRSLKAGIGVLEAFLRLLKAIFYRFAVDPEVMGDCKLASQICQHPAGLLDIITSRQSTLITRSTALELCPLLMVTSKSSQTFAQQCLLKVLEDGRFNPFEPGFKIEMSRTFQRGSRGQLRSVDISQTQLVRTYTIGEHISSLLFQSMDDVFVDEESVMRLTFMTVIKAMNTLTRLIIEADEKEKKMEEDLKNKSSLLTIKNSRTSSTPKTKRKKKKYKIKQPLFRPNTGLRRNNSDSSIGSLSSLSSMQSIPKTPSYVYEFDPDLQVDHLDGEFDASTARKIRNFFSRDADYTRKRILELIEAEDDVLIDVLLELLIIESALRKSKSRLAVRIRYLFDPFILFHDFIEVTAADHTLLLEFLISNETSFLDYLLRFCKRMAANWNPIKADKSKIVRVMSILIRLRMQISSLHARHLFPYSPKALLKAMEYMEFCYETSFGAYSGQEVNWNDIEYTHSLERKKMKLEAKEKKEEEERLVRKLNKPKKLAIKSCFLQDVKYEKEMNKRAKEIAVKTAKNLKRRNSQTNVSKIKFSEKKPKIKNRSKIGHGGHQRKKTNKMNSKASRHLNRAKGNPKGHKINAEKYAKLQCLDFKSKVAAFQKNDDGKIRKPKKSGKKSKKNRNSNGLIAFDGDQSERIQLGW